MEFKNVEEARIKYHNKVRRIWLIGLPIGTVIALVVLILYVMREGMRASTFIIPITIFLFTAAVVGIVVLFATRKEAEAWHSAYKSYFVEKNMAQIFTNLRYDHKAGMSKDFLRSSGMVSTGDRYHSEDLAMANYKGVNFVQADAHIETEHRDSDGNTTYVTIFRGRFMVFEFPKKFNFKLELIGRRFGSAARVPGKNSENGRKMEKMSTESVDFNKTFKIYSEDGFETFYILDPAFMEKIMKISGVYEDKVLLGFIDNTLFIGVNNGKDSFEPPKSSKPLDEKVEAEKVSKEIRIITDFVDQLNLDKKLFVK